MLDIKYIRENQEKVKEACAAKQVDCDVDKILELDEKRRKLTTGIEELRAAQNKLGKEDAEKGRTLKEEIKKAEPELNAAEKELENLLYGLPNIPLDGVPLGDESRNKVLKTKGTTPQFTFEPRDHLDLGEALDVIDVKRAAKVSGSRFAYLKGDLVLLEFALIQLAMAEAVNKGFIPVIPPSLIKLTVTDGLGYWDRGGAQDYYQVFDKEQEAEQGGYYLIGTAEHAIVPMHKDEVFEEIELPKRYVGFSSAFRKEAG
ncbi:MAG: serine--tRNA ligase, partial [bacterium]|nr:serine--tRNA ligase [bacterium]